MPSHAPVSFRVLWMTMGSVFVVWTLLFTLMQFWEHKASDEKYLETLNLKAEMLHENTEAIRSWIGEHGGIYVVVDKSVHPNPLLKGIEERDVVTPEGRRLTLYNSPAFLRHVMTEFEARSGSRVRLVSQNPINPANVPDDWERERLLRLTPTTGKISEMTEINGRPFYRILSPMTLEEPCLKCHQYNKKEVGGLIGAVSISLDAEPDFKAHKTAEQALLLSHVGMWFVGTLGLFLGGWRWRQLLFRLEQSAVSDPLTGLYNRRELMDRLKAEVASAQRHKTELSMIMLDIDHFKHVNDTYGHQAGDDVLMAVTQIMQNMVRISDLLARYGGEEFVVVCSHTGIEGATELAERIRQSVMEKPLSTRKGGISVTLSAGVAEYTGQQSPEELIKMIDEALYEAKETGRNKVCRSA